MVDDSGAMDAVVRIELIIISACPNVADIGDCFTPVDWATEALLAQ